MPPSLSGSNSGVVGQLASALIFIIGETDVRVEIIIPAAWLPGGRVGHQGCAKLPLRLRALTPCPTRGLQASGINTGKDSWDSVYPTSSPYREDCGLQRGMRHLPESLTVIVSFRVGAG